MAEQQALIQGIDDHIMTSQLNLHLAAAISAGRLREVRRCQTFAGVKRPRRSP